MNDKTYIERLEDLLRLYAGCNVCTHFVDYLTCDIGGKCNGKEWKLDRGEEDVCRN